MPVIPAVWEAEAGGSQVQSQPQHLIETLSKSVILSSFQRIAVILALLIFLHLGQKANARFPSPEVILLSTYICLVFTAPFKKHDITLTNESSAC
uniref:Uncharacterized protein n=1 Tax=Urocitellus parryii TaxID=9999 RepID=A0A8D2H1K0_UROPR